MTRTRRTFWLTFIGLAMLLAAFEDLAFQGGLGLLILPLISVGIFLLVSAVKSMLQTRPSPAFPAREERHE